MSAQEKRMMARMVSVMRRDGKGSLADSVATAYGLGPFDFITKPARSLVRAVTKPVRTIGRIAESGAREVGRIVRRTADAGVDVARQAGMQAVNSGATALNARLATADPVGTVASALQRRGRGRPKGGRIPVIFPEGR